MHNNQYEFHIMCGTDTITIQACRPTHHVCTRPFCARHIVIVMKRDGFDRLSLQALRMITAAPADCHKCHDAHPGSSRACLVAQIRLLASPSVAARTASGTPLDLATSDSCSVHGAMVRTNRYPTASRHSHASLRSADPSAGCDSRPPLRLRCDRRCSRLFGTPVIRRFKYSVC